MIEAAFLDTCSLFGQSVCDLLLTLAEHGCFTPYWSGDVLDSLERNVAERGRASPEAVRRRRVLMELAFPDALVEGYESLIETMTNHPGDRHVLAACVVSPARTLVTFNTRDFPAVSVGRFGVEVVDPDTFVVDLLDLYPDRSAKAVSTILRRNRHPPRDITELRRVLEAAGLPAAAAALRGLEL